MEVFWITLRDLLGEHKSAKLILIIGILLILFTNFIDQQIYYNRKCIFNWKYTDFLFFTGFLLSAGSIIYILIMNFYGLYKAYRYKKKYQINNLDRTYYLFNFNSKGFLFDIDKKTHHWIASWQTAQDCDFQEYWTKNAKGLEELLEKKEKIVTISGKHVNLNEFRKVGSKIHTRGIPGT